MTTPWITPPSAQTLSGDEPIIGTASSVRDFWAWGMSNLRTNTLRSMLAEYLVACAVGVQRTQRIEWDAFDLQIPEGRIEVKSSAYLQAWDQPRNSRIAFSGLRAKTWDPRTRLSEHADYNADVYVFAVQAASTHDQYDALDTTQWQFWVLPRTAVAATGYKSMSLATVKDLAGAQPVPYENLKPAVLAALSLQR